PDEALVRGDEHLLSRVVANLVDNAARHGSGPVSATLEQSERELILRLWNDGPSIPPSHRDLVFEPFVRAPGGGAPGFGLGLAFVRAVARAHGGDAIVGDRNQGVEIVICLPVAAAV